MVRRTILATLLSTGAILLMIKIGFVSIILDSAMRIINPLVGFTKIEVLHISLVALVSSITTTLIINGKLPLPQFIKRWLK